MKLTKVLMPAALTLALFSGHTMAVELSPAATSDNTVTFLGQVTDSTCEITLNGQPIKPVVLLPTVSASELATADSRAGTTDFVVRVSNCQIVDPTPARAMVDAKTISTVFIAHETHGTNLKNTIGSNAGGAENVHINIIDPRVSNGGDIDFSKRFYGNGDLQLKEDNSAQAIYKAQYIAPEGNATAGYVRASMQYALSYD